MVFPRRGQIQGCGQHFGREHAVVDGDVVELHA